MTIFHDAFHDAKYYATSASSKHAVPAGEAFIITSLINKSGGAFKLHLAGAVLEMPGTPFVEVPNLAVAGGSSCWLTRDGVEDMPAGSLIIGYERPVTAAFALDTNDGGAVTAGVLGGGTTEWCMEVQGVTGAHTTHVIRPQCSIDGTVWYGVADTQSLTLTDYDIGVGAGAIQFPCSFPHVRAKVQTAEGGASTSGVNIYRAN